MSEARGPAATVDEYIAALPPKTRALVERIRRTIRKAEPRVEEGISYRIPAFRLDGQYLVYVAAFANHVGVYPAPIGDEAFNAAAAPYRSGKATLQFQVDQPLPLDLILGVLTFRKRALIEHARARAAKRTSARPTPPPRRAPAGKPAPRRPS
jgi:uncharacterized protein YdhG (YjbR/CyaY superfamily)